MESTARKIGNSVGAIFPKEIAPAPGEKFNVYKIDGLLIFKPKKQDIFSDMSKWDGFRDSITTEDKEWTQMASEGDEL